MPESPIRTTAENVEVCGHGLPISGPDGEFVECEGCDAGNAESDSFLPVGGGSYGGGSL